MLYSLSVGCHARVCLCKVCSSAGLRLKSIGSKDSTYILHLKTLGLTRGADQEAVRKAFLNLCKRYHPDSGSPEANSVKFQEVDEAYKYILKKFSDERWNLNEGVGEYGLYYDENKKRRDIDEQVEEFDIKHTAPQHRQYLSWDGTGSGTPSQRQHQYTQIRAAQAAERVREHRFSRLENQENSLTTQDRKRVNKAKTRHGMERLVEDLIQESMARGEFENLSGAGKPLRQRIANPYVDFITQKMNEIMVDNGFTPEWITLGREIEEECCAIRNTLYRQSRFRNDTKKWKEVMSEMESSSKAVNKKIELFNLVVPILQRQMLLFNLNEECKKILSLPPPETEKSKNKRDEAPCNGEFGQLFSTLVSFFRNH